MTVREDAGFTRDDLVSFLEANRVETRSCLRATCCVTRPFRASLSVSSADLSTPTVMTDTFFIGVYPGLDAARLDYVKPYLSGSCGASASARERA